MSARVRRAALGAALGGAAVIGLIGSCTQVSTDPNSVLSIQLSPTVLPSVVVGDQLHDATGAVDSLHAQAFNNQGLPVADAPVRFLALPGPLPKHTVVAVDAVTGHVVGVDTGSAKVLAYVGLLQTLPQTIFVVFHPDSVIPLDAVDFVLDTVQLSLRYNTSTLRDTTLPLGVKLVHFATPDSLPISPYRLQYAFTDPLYNPLNIDALKLRIVNSARQPQLVDTTDATGSSTLSVSATLLTAPVTDVLVGIDLSAFEPDQTTPIPGSPVHFLIHLTVCTTGTATVGCP